MAFSGATTVPNPRNLIINYIPTPVTDEKLRELFEPFGAVESARVILDKATNHPKGYGFVKYATEEGARKAIENMNGFEIGNKRLRVTQANGPQNRSIQQYSDRIIQIVPQPGAPQQQVLPQQYTLIGTGAPICPQPTSNMPTFVLAQPPGAAMPQAPVSGLAPPTNYSYLPGVQGQSTPNTIVVEMDGTPVQLVTHGALPPIFQQYGSAAPPSAVSVSGGSQPLPFVRPLSFVPFRSGSPQSDPMMRSSFLSVGASSSGITSATSFEPNRQNISNIMVGTPSVQNPPQGNS